MIASEISRNVAVAPPAANGLFREALAGRGRTLTDAFDRLEHSKTALHVSRHERRNLFGARVPLEPHEGEGHYEFTRIGSSVYVIVQKAAYKQTRVEFVPGDDLIQFYFCLSGDLTLETGAPEPLRINRPSLLLWRQPRGVDIEEWTGAGTKSRAVAITVDRRYLSDEFLSDSVDANALSEFINAEAGGLQYCQVPLTSQMYELATRLIDKPHQGTLGLIFTEAVTFELLCLTISSLRVPALGSACEGFSDRQLRSLHSARALLMKQMSPAPTIRQVARAAGINQTSLKRGFKALFGETIFDFSVRYRMRHAMKLLGDRSMPVSRIAEAVGYGHQTSFATAFRRHFGVCPKKVRSASSSH